MADKRVGYVLPVEHSSSTDYHTFPGFPGRFLPGEPLALRHMGLPEDEADRLLEEMGLPLQKTEMTVAAFEAEIDRGDNYKPSGGASVADLAALTHAELDSVAEQANVEIPAGATKEEKAEALAEAGVQAPEEANE